MQNRKLIITALMTLFSSGSFADDIQATGENAGGLPAPIQDHISRLMEDDVAFNQAEHQLSQQLTLAKLRLEMAKIKSEAADLTQGPILNMNNESADKDIQPTPLPAAAEPRVMMLSQIAGITQAAVAVGSKTVFVRIGEIFTANGKRYAVHQGSNAQQSFVRGSLPVILDFIRLTEDSIHSGEWIFAEIEDRMLIARSGTQEYLVSQRSLIEELHILQYEVRKMNDIHHHKIAGIGGVTEAVYFKIYELVSLQKLSRVALDISETQKELEAILIEAVNMGASDLHITRNDILAQLEVRVNGMLLPMMQMPASKCDELVFVLYNVQASTRDTTWNRTIPQSANILYTLNALSFRFRYAHFPIFGETNDCYHAVLRIIPSGLSKSAVANLNKLGISNEELDDLKKILSNPYGAYFIAGTTGSGKSTTLKNLMEWLQINRYGNKGCFLTVEDPVEYQIYGAKQSSVVSVEGGGFHSAIKSALRRDPDVLMVGEIRDTISANALAGAVESGHYCFTTVHAGNIVSLLQRLSAMGITSDKLSTPGFIAGLQCQKLVPVICSHCHRPVDISFGGELMSLYEQYEDGCERCKYTGIGGRQLVMEYMRPTYDELAAISKQEWLQVYTLWREKRLSAPGMSEGFEIKEKVFAEVLRGRVCATWFNMEFGDVDKDNREIIHGKVR